MNKHSDRPAFISRPPVRCIPRLLMKPHPATPTRLDNAIEVVAALAGIGLTVLVNAVCELRAAAALAVYVLVGFPTYRLLVLAYAGWRKRQVS